jgi:hypothetical protein
MRQRQTKRHLSVLHILLLSFSCPFLDNNVLYSISNMLYIFIKFLLQKHSNLGENIQHQHDFLLFSTDHQHESVVNVLTMMIYYPKFEKRSKNQTKKKFSKNEESPIESNLQQSDTFPFTN